jgi:hypothetical protein
LPDDAEKKYGVGYATDYAVGRFAYHHHYHRSVVEQQKQTDEEMT